MPDTRWSAFNQCGDRTPEGVSLGGVPYDPARQVKLWQAAQERKKQAERDATLLAAPLETAARDLGCRTPKLAQIDSDGRLRFYDGKGERTFSLAELYR